MASANVDPQGNVPALVFELARDHGGAQSVSVFGRIPQKGRFRLFGERRDGKVVDTEHVDLGETREKSLIRAVSASHRRSFVGRAGTWR